MIVYIGVLHVFMLVHTHTHTHTHKWEDIRTHVFVKEKRNIIIDELTL